jgi:leucyl-tRNA synthetase
MNWKIHETGENYSKMLYKEVLKRGFFEFQAARDKYLQLSDRINWTLIMKYIELQIIILSPICPHVCEYVWELIGKVSGFNIKTDGYKFLVLHMKINEYDLFRMVAY